MTVWLSFLIILLSPVISLAKDYIVKLRDFNSFAYWQFYQDQNIRVVDAHEPGLLLKLSVADNASDEFFQTLSVWSGVEYVVENISLSIPRVVQIYSPVRLSPQYGLELIQAPLAWKISGHNGNRSIKVAVIDTGVDYRHRNLAGNVGPGYDFFEQDDDPMDVPGIFNPGHGTHVAGIIGANGLIENGITGVMPQVTIVPIRFLGPNGGGDLMNAVKAIDYAISQKVAVINASWGARVRAQKVQPLIEAVQRAAANDIVFVAAAGNESANNDRVSTYPANVDVDTIISVAATTQKDELAKFSNFGQQTVHLAAPGDEILSTLPKDRYGKLSGTSMAAPHVAAAAAFIRSLGYPLTAAEIRSLLLASGDRGRNLKVACGCRLNLAQAVKMLQDGDLWLHPYFKTLKVGDVVDFQPKGGVGPYRWSLVSGQKEAILSHQGRLKALKPGVVQVQVVDARGRSFTSLPMVVKPAPKGR